MATQGEHTEQHTAEPAAPTSRPASFDAVPAALSSLAGGMGNHAFGTLGEPRRSVARAVRPPENRLEPVAGWHAAADAERYDIALARAVLARRGADTIARRSASDEMAARADYDEARAGALPPPRIVEMSTVSDVAEARRQIAKVAEGQTHMLEYRAAIKYEQKEDAESWLPSSYKDKEQRSNDLDKLTGYIAKNEDIKGVLQGIVDLSSGASSPVKGYGGGQDVDVTVGHDTRMSVFTNMYLALKRDSVRLQGVVAGFLGANPNVKVQAGEEGGFALGKAIATGGRSDKAPQAVSEDVKAAQKGDEKLKELVEEYKKSLDEYTTADHGKLIDDAVKAASIKSNNLKNVAADLRIPVKREDTPEEAKALADVAKINADLAQARAAIDKVQAVVQIAASLAGVPLPSVSLGTTPASMPPSVEKANETSFKGQTDVKIGDKSVASVPTAEAGAAAGEAGKWGGAAAKTLDIDVGAKIKGEMAKVMVDYDARMLAANQKIEALKYHKEKFLEQLNKSKIDQARTEFETEAAKVHEAVVNSEKAKKKIRDAAGKLTQHQSTKGQKGGPDIAAMSQALGEVTIFIEQAKQAQKQGAEEQKLADEMVKRREGLAGKYKETDPSDRSGRDMLGNQRIGAAEGEKAYYDAKKEGSKYFLSMNPVRFELWSDKVKQTPDASRSEVKKILTEIEEELGRAESMKAALHTAMFGA